MRKISLLVSVMFVFFVAGAFASTAELTRIREKLTKYKRVQGSFEQVRQVKDVKLKLQSSGKFDFKQPLDLKWSQSKPFAMDLLMTPEKIVQKSFDGSEQVILKQDQPVIFVFSSSFLSIFSGDPKKMESTFDASAVFKDQRWTVDLKPKDELLKKAILKIEIQGQEFVEKVLITEVSGNSTTIQFAHWKGTH